MRVQKIIWEISCCSFSSLSDFFCVKRPDGMFGDVWTVILNVWTYILVVQTIWVLRPDVFVYRPDGRVFATVYVAQHPDVTYVPSGR
jgi:hypothetical protein